MTDPPYELGFMGKKWDASGVSFDPDTWRAVLRVLKPGAHLLAFGGTRTYHRIVCAIEDAGFEICDQLDWIYGSGMPKSRTALKPGHEPICLARKPLVGTVAMNVKRFGTGALNIDGCRIGFANELDKQRAKPGTTPATPNGNGVTHGSMARAKYVQPAGRWPANVILDEAAAAMLDEQSGDRKSGGYPPEGGMRSRGVAVEGGTHARGAPAFAGSIGGASRFFYVAKASRRERSEHNNVHPTVKPIELMRHLVKLVTPSGGIILDPFAGSGTTGVAAIREGFQFYGVERESSYAQIARRRLKAA